jgi:hypothetical protein
MFEYIEAQQPIGKREVYLRYGHMFITTGFVNEHFPPDEALALLEWLEQHKDTLQQAALRMPRKAHQQVGNGGGTDGPDQEKEEAHEEVHAKPSSLPRP